MDGLSGMKIGSKFNIDTSYLPSNYPTTVDFLIKNIVHEIKDNKWTTSLESYCIAKGSKELASMPGPSPNQPPPAPVPSPQPQPQPNTPSPQGKNPDLWTLVAISATENFSDNPQGMADVAQSIYNRYRVKKYPGSSSLKGIILASGQYEPVFRNIADWKAIDSKDTAIKAYMNSRKTSKTIATKAIETSYNAITNAVYKNAAKAFVGSRTEFLANRPTSSKAVGAIERQPGIKNNVFFWNYAGKDELYSKGILSAQPPPSNLPELL
jgi:hypothetical protein